MPPAGAQSKAMLVSRITMTLPQAAAVAAEQIPGTVVDAELVQREGVPVWNFLVFTPDSKEVRVSVDAEEGCLIE